MVCAAKGRPDENAATELHIARNQAQGMRRHIPLELFENQLAKIVHKASLSWRGATPDEAEIGDDICVLYRGTRTTAQRPFMCCVCIGGKAARSSRIASCKPCDDRSKSNSRPL